MTPPSLPGAASVPQHGRHARRARIWLVSGTVAFGLLVAALMGLRSEAPPYTPGTEAAGSDEITRVLDRDVPDEAPRVPFAEAATEAGLRFRHFHGTRSTQLPEDMGSGAAWGDYDDDGDPDLYLVNESGPLTSPSSSASVAASPAHSALFRNEGNGRFSDVTREAGVGADGLGMGAAWGDYDGDGDLDLAVTRFGTSLLFRNDGADHFTDVSSVAGIDKERGFWTGASWADYDRDGDLDLYVCGYVRYALDRGAAQNTTHQFGSLVPYTLNPSSYPPERNLLFRNDGGRFREVARQAGVDNLTGRSLSASWCDFDGDGWVDLYVANDVSDNAMFHNGQDGTFDDVSHASWAADYRGAMGLGIGDWENDGDFDIFITHWIAQENALYENQNDKMPPSPTEPTRFIDQADIVGLGHIALDYVGWGTGFFDYDNDGRQDLYVANGSTFQKEQDPSALVPMINLLFWNAGPAKGFYEVGQVAGLPFAVANVGRGAAAADYDQDGDLDIVVVVNGGEARLLRNDGDDTNGWLRLILRGPPGRTGHRGQRVKYATASHAEGTFVSVTTGDVRQIRQIGAGSSYLSQDPPGETHIGLGAAGSIDVLEIRWPSGRTQLFRDLPARATVTIVEGSEPLVVLPAKEANALAPGETIVARDEQILVFWRLMNDATSLRTSGDYAAAADRLEEALVIDPSHEDALYYLGQSLRETRQFEASRAAFERLVEANRSSARGHLALGALLASPEEGAPFDLHAAERHLRAAHEINKEETGSMVRLGEILIVTGNHTEAREWLLAAARTNPKSIEGPFLSGYLAWLEGDRTRAAAFYQQSVTAAIVDVPVKGVLSEGDRKTAPAPGSTVGMTLLGSFAAQSGEADLERIYRPVRAFIADLARRQAPPSRSRTGA